MNMPRTKDNTMMSSHTAQHFDPSVLSETTSKRPKVPGGLYARCKPALDWLAAVVILIPALPLIGFCWAIVRIVSPGPGFYSQTRLGRNGQPYKIFKIRTMHHNVEQKTGGAKWSSGVCDTRAFAFGKFLRKSHLDELPQLFNVVMGHMSLVGPRPERPEIIDALNLVKQVPGYEHRLMVKPGVTGLAQLQLPADSDILSVRHKVVYDIFYIEHQSIWLDARLIVATAIKSIGCGPTFIQKAFFLPKKDTVRDIVSARVQLPMPDQSSGRLQPA
jgi:lipopolysaccharide/colanic/teichoic acid biosynthesis glycosyltransferase